VFISYASSDRAIAEAIARQMERAGCPVWFDRDQLMAGMHWEEVLEDAVMNRCSLFLSLISRNTEKKIDAYYIWERNWAMTRSRRFSERAAFYVPVRIDEGELIPKNEPIRAARIQATKVTNGILPDALLFRICRLVKGYCQAQDLPVPKSLPDS
jgi:hypothetical protein